MTDWDLGSLYIKIICQHVIGKVAQKWQKSARQIKYKGDESGEKDGKNTSL